MTNQIDRETKVSEYVGAREHASVFPFYIRVCIYTCYWPRRAITTKIFTNFCPGLNFYIYLFFAAYNGR